MAARELFVWYRVRSDRVDEARMAVLVLQQSLRGRWPGMQARLLIRDDGETSTWMETYSLPGDTDDAGIDSAIEAAIAAAAQSLERLIDGARHVEAFAAVA
jgi:hypothetical protein